VAGKVQAEKITVLTMNGHSIYLSKSISQFVIFSSETDSVRLQRVCMQMAQISKRKKGLWNIYANVIKYIWFL